MSWMISELRLGTAALFTLALLLLGAGTASAQVQVQPLQEYGTTGNSGPGGVDAADGIAVDPISGKVVVPDWGNQRVAVFSPKGKFLRAFGKDVVPGGGTGPEVCTVDCQAGLSGDGEGEFSYVAGAQVSPDGKLIYLGDYDNQRISVFTMGGEFQFAFGKDVVPGGGTGPEVCREECKRGETGVEGGAFDGPWTSTFGPDGDLYATNTDNNRIERFTPTGEPVAAYGRDVNASGGDGGFEVCSGAQCQRGAIDQEAGSLRRPEGIDFDPDGRIWVGSWDDSQASVVTTEPSFELGLGRNVVPGQSGFGICTSECQFGSSGIGAGELSNAQGVAVDARGIAYVADSSNNRINSYAGDGGFRFSFGYDVNPGGGTELEICTDRTGCKEGAANGALNNPYPVQVDCRGTIYVASSNDGHTSAFGTSKKADPGPCRLKPQGVVPNRRRGTAKLKVLVPYAGKLVLNGKGVKRVRDSHEGLEGNERLTVKPSKKLKRKLRRTGKRKNVRVTLKMRPSDGNAVQKRTVKVALKAKKKRR